MKRERLGDLGWFQNTRRMAIADVVYVEGIGICSHQPRFGQYETEDQHRVMDADGGIHIVDTDRLFTATHEETRDYWSSITSNGG